MEEENASKVDATTTTTTIATFTQRQHEVPKVQWSTFTHFSPSPKRNPWEQCNLVLEKLYQCVFQ
jgi:hypothetical protein